MSIKQLSRRSTWRSGGHSQKSSGGSIIRNHSLSFEILTLAIWLSLSCLTGVAICGESGKGNDLPLPVADSLERQIVNDAFGLGERLTFSIGYGPITAGTAFLEVVDTNTFQGRLCYMICSQTNSNGFFDNFYKVRDTVFSQLDVDGLFSRHFFKALHEGSYHSSREIALDHANRRAYFRKGTDQPDTVALLAFANDELSALYYVRTLPLEVGKSVKVPAVSGDTSQMIEVRVLRRETVEVPAGEFKCIVVEPMLTAAGVFKQEGDIKVWLTDDRLRMPVLMKSKILVGSIYAELEEFKLGNLDW